MQSQQMDLSNRLEGCCMKDLPDDLRPRVMDCLKHLTTAPRGLKLSVMAMGTEFPPAANGYKEIVYTDLDFVTQALVKSANGQTYSIRFAGDCAPTPQDIRHAQAAMGWTWVGGQFDGRLGTCSVYGAPEEPKYIGGTGSGKRFLIGRKESA